MKKLISTTLLIVCAVFASAQQTDSKLILSGSDLQYYHAATKEVETYLKNTCHQLNTAKRNMILEYGLLKHTEAKRNIVGYKRVQAWNAVLQIKYNCTEKDYYDFTRFFNFKTE